MNGIFFMISWNQSDCFSGLSVLGGALSWWSILEIIVYPSTDPLFFVSLRIFHHLYPVGKFLNMVLTYNLFSLVLNFRPFTPNAHHQLIMFLGRWWINALNPPWILCFPLIFGGVPSIMVSPINSSDGGTFEQERCMDLGYHEESWSNSLLSSMFEFLIEVYFSRDGFIPN